MRRPRRPLFLARAPYRRRRLRDAARLLPVMGLLLLILPLFWTARAQVTLSSGDVTYFFLVWAGLIALAAAFAPGLRSGESRDEEDD
jgi:peptidoglycan/LPS O-acetylase OafA/YrhL